MPYVSVDELPVYVREYSVNVKRQWMHVFNTVYDSTKSEARALKASNSVLKKRFTKGQNVSNESHKDYMNHLIDSYFGKLIG